MTAANALCSLTDLRAALRIDDFEDDTTLELARDAATEMINQRCSRIFVADTAATARLFVAATETFCVVDDISSTSGLVVEASQDGTTWTTWTATDYQLEPLNGRNNGTQWAYTGIRAIDQQLFYIDGRHALVRVTARWGWPAIPEAIRKAAVVQAIALFKADDAPFGAVGFGETGVLRLRALHPTAEALVSPYINHAVRIV